MADREDPPVKPSSLALLVALALSPLARGGTLDEELVQLQQDWEVIRYQTPAHDREKRFEALAERAHRVVEAQPQRAEPRVWEGIIVSSWADEKGGWGALRLVERAREMYESALRIDDHALDGSAYLGLGVLYLKAPGWPLGFGDTRRARELLERALALNPEGLDANCSYGEYLLEAGHPAEAASYLERALRAPLRPGRHVADTARREEARALLDKARAAR